MATYKKIRRLYINDNGDYEYGSFIAGGQWADGHLAYSRLDDNGNEIEGEECAYVQLRDQDFHGLYMQRI